MQKNVLIIGGDKRQYHLYKLLKNHNFNISVYKVINLEDSEKDISTLIEKNDFIIFPIPFTRDNKNVNCCFGKISIEEIIKLDLRKKVVLAGAAKKEYADYFNKNCLTFFDYYKDPLFTYYNCIATAEGTIKILLEKTKRTIFESKILITGFGNVTKFLAERLKLLGADVFIAARNKEQRALALSKKYNVESIDNILKFKDVDIVINTPNAKIFNEKLVKSFSENTIFIDLASEPGGFDLDLKYYDNIFIERGIPSKVCENSAGEYIYKSFINNFGGCLYGKD